MSAGVLGHSWRGVIAGTGMGDNWPGQAFAWSASTSRFDCTAAAFDNSPMVDTDGIWQGDGSFIIPPGLEGLWRVTVAIGVTIDDWQSATLAYVGCGVAVNGSDPFNGVTGVYLQGLDEVSSLKPAPATGGTLITSSVELAAGDVIRPYGLAGMRDPLQGEKPYSFHGNVRQFVLERLDRRA